MEVTIGRRTYVLTLLAVCVVSAAIGSGITLLAKTGPEGPVGPAGPEGPAGEPDTDARYEAEEARYMAEEAISEIDDLESRIQDFEFLDPAESDEVDDLERKVSDLESLTSEICFEVGLIC